MVNKGFILLREVAQMDTLRSSLIDAANPVSYTHLDYLTKPFEIDELLARITVQLRSRPIAGGSHLLTFKELTLDAEGHRVSVESTDVHLTKTEFAILKLLMRNPRQVITKAVMLERISSDTPDCMETSLKVHISNLRKKLRDVNGKD